MLICPNGHENPDDHHFCKECGAPLTDSQDPIKVLERRKEAADQAAAAAERAADEAEEAVLEKDEEAVEAEEKAVEAEMAAAKAARELRLGKASERWRRARRAVSSIWLRS
jgi:hypothetical protein